MMGLEEAMGTQEEEEAETGADELAEVPVAPPADRLGRRLMLLLGRFPRATRQSSQSHTYGLIQKLLSLQVPVRVEQHSGYAAAKTLHKLNHETTIRNWSLFDFDSI